MEDLRKKYNEDSIAIGIWDCSFYFVDGDGNAVSDEKGKVRIFTADDHDYSDMADRVEFDELSEVGKKEELTIDINQYLQFDEDGEMKIYIQIDKFLNDAVEYLKNDNPEYEIVKE